MPSASPSRPATSRRTALLSAFAAIGAASNVTATAATMPELSPAFSKALDAFCLSRDRANDAATDAEADRLDQVTAIRQAAMIDAAETEADGLELLGLAVGQLLQVSSYARADIEAETRSGDMMDLRMLAAAAMALGIDPWPDEVDASA